MYFIENLNDKVLSHTFQDNKFAVSIYYTKIENTVIYMSNIVGKCIPKYYYKNKIKKGDLLFIIEFLGIKYYIKSEYESTVLAAYIIQDTLVDYHYPLILLYLK